MNTPITTRFTHPTPPAMPNPAFAFRPAEVIVAAAKVLLPFVVMAGILLLAR
ncbi:hypothetical protein [Pigmentiphaga sp.]|uniref:hypothetical protein n=1 Tax=Pigmentiphaga sp. TaxID=1977564 RepID=UPI0025F75991|nr:hypothetical protein [Pigmentiphaga sp.]